ncbi:MAG TPA: hypothetical protein VHS53_00725, partial [Mucilaginibacter sp.]|nr:hypothetical protein [Mucilaginibacter sp.]
MNSYAFHINLYDVAFFGMLFVSFTFIVLLWFTKKVSQRANRLLATAVAVVTLPIARILAIDVRLDVYIHSWSLLPLHFSLAFGPLIFFYVLKITQPENRFRATDMLHFSPLILELSAHLFAIIESKRTGVPTYDTLTFQRLDPILQLLVFVSVGIYLLYSYKLINRYYRRMKFYGGDRYHQGLRWLHNILTGISMLWISGVFFSGMDYFYYHRTLSIHAYYPIYLLLGFGAIWIAALVHTRPDVCVVTDVPRPLKTLLPADLKQKGVWLRKVTKENLYYQDPDLSLTSLAEKLSISPHELSRVINVALKKN